MTEISLLCLCFCSSKDSNAPETDVISIASDSNSGNKTNLETHKNLLCKYGPQYVNILIARKRSLRRLCFHRSVHEGWGGGVCIRGVGLHPGVGLADPPGYYGIRSTSGRYAPYWNAFLSCKYVVESHRTEAGPVPGPGTIFRQIFW